MKGPRMVDVKGPHRSEGTLEGMCQKCTRIRHFQTKELQNFLVNGLSKLALSPNFTPLVHQSHECIPQRNAGCAHVCVQPDGPH